MTEKTLSAKIAKIESDSVFVAVKYGNFVKMVQFPLEINFRCPKCKNVINIPLIDGSIAPLCCNEGCDGIEMIKC